MVTLSQPLEALEVANHRRLDAFALRVELAAGLIALADAIHDERAGSLTVHRFLTAQRGIGNHKATRVCNRVMVHPRKKIRELTLRQKGLVVAEVLR